MFKVINKFVFFSVVLAIFLITGCVNTGDRIRYDSNAKSEDEKKNNCPPPDLVLDLSQEIKEHLISTAYRAIHDVIYENSRTDFSDNYNGMDNTVYVTIRLNGKKISWDYETRSDNLEKSVYLSSANAFKTAQEGMFINEIQENTRKINIEVTILGGEKKNNELFGFEPGLHSIRIKDQLKNSVLLNKDIVENNYGQKKSVISTLCRAIGRSDFCNENQNGSDTPEFYISETLNFGNTYLTGEEVITFYRGNKIKCGTPSADDVKNALRLTEKWLANNVRKDGYLNYEYNPSVWEYSENNNIVRQLFTSRCLAETSQRNETVEIVHKKNLDYIFKNWYCEKGKNIGYVCFSDASELGANAGLIRTLVYSPYFEEYRKFAKKIAEAVISVQKEDGSFSAFVIKPKHYYNEERAMTYYSGETILALTEFYNKTGEQKYLDAAVRAQNYYLVKYVDQMKKNYKSAYVPWHSQSLFKLYRIIKKDSYLKAILKMTDRLIRIQNTDGKPFTDYRGRFVKLFSSDSHSSSDGVFTEGLCYAYEAAKILEDKDRQNKYKERVLLGLENIIRLQFTGANMYYIEEDDIDKVEGGVRTNTSDNRIRIDNVQHAFDAFSAAILFLVNNS